MSVYELKELLSIFKKHKTNIERESLDDIIEVFCCASVLKYSRYGSVFNDDFNTCSTIELFVKVQVGRISPH